MLKTADILVYPAFAAKSKVEYVDNTGRKSIKKEIQKDSLNDGALYGGVFEGSLFHKKIFLGVGLFEGVLSEGGREIQGHAETLKPTYRSLP